jgi:hypothetical protein
MVWVDLYLTNLFLMAIRTQTFFAFVRAYLPLLAFFTAGHTLSFICPSSNHSLGPASILQV